jgi:hypothetical protein
MAGRFSIGRVVVVVVVVQAEAVVGSKLKSPSELSPKTFRLQLPCGTRLPRLRNYLEQPMV